MTPEATLWAEAQQVPLVPCLGEPDTGHISPVVLPDADGKFRPHGPDCCGGTGEVRSDVYRTIERAITVPCTGYVGADGPHGRLKLVCLLEVQAPGIFNSLPKEDCVCKGTGRSLRPQPGVMTCDDCGGRGEFEDGGSWCKTCGGSDTVPDPSEAGVVARDEACGRFWPIYRALPYSSAAADLFIALVDTGDYNDVLAETLAAVQAMAQESVTP